MTATSFSIDDVTPAAGGAVTAVLGPTNTGKTHYALERMLAHRSGMIGLPLRLLAREIYDRVVEARGPRAVALVTGEEKIIPPSARYWVATVEAMPLERAVDFMAVDEVQLAADPERGRIFTSRILHARGKSETLLLGADTMRPVLKHLFPDIQFLSRTRFSKLSYAGPKKISRLPRRSAVVAFSADTVYAIAELIRRQRGGAAVVLGALSPRTRNAQAELYQSGEVDFLVATDAIGMGLNMSIDHVALAARRKFDGRRPRDLTHAEIAQVAGRAGRHINDGTFGVTGDCPPLDEDTVLAVEDHQFDPVRLLQWRTEQIDFTSLPALTRALDTPPPRPMLIRSQREDDEDALHRLCAMNDIRDIARGGAALSTLWDVCQIPDFRKISHDAHARLLADIYLTLMHKGRLSDAFIEPHISRLNRFDGDIDALSARIAHVRTWTFLSHRSAWLENAAYWQERARAIEDKLSDALHEKLTHRFVDRRTSALLQKLKDDAPLLAGVNDDGEVIVEGQFIGRLLGFEFIVDPRASGAEAKSLRAAGEKALRPVLAARAGALANADADELSLSDDGIIQWRSADVARLKKGPAPLRPDVLITGLDQITPNLRGRVEDRIKDFVTAKLEAQLGPLIMLQASANAGEGDDALKPHSRGVAFRLVENFGATSRTQFGDELKQISQDERAKLRKIGMRFGEYTLHLPALLKPAPARLLTLLWSLWGDKNPNEAPPPKAGLVSIEMSEQLPHAYYYAAGYRPSGVRAVRIDMLERLASLIRTARNNASAREGFEATPQMMSLVGCSGEDFEAILRSLGFRKQTIKRKVETPAPAAPDALAKKDPSEASASETKPPQEDTPAASENEVQTENATPTPENATDAPTEDDGAPATTNDAVSETASSADTPTSSGPSSTAPEAPSPGETAEGDSAATSETPADAASDQTSNEAETGTDADAQIDEIEVTVWRMAPRKPHARPNNQRQNADQQQRGRGKFRGDKNAKPGGGKRKGGKHGGQRPPGQAPRPRREKKADPDSPFAVLAGLKAELGESNDKPKAKAPEKTE
ncbi:MAG: helicase-related protein [Pseudomonadota bacterium]